jgi:hypothetical protein
MFMLMVNGAEDAPGDLLWFLIVVAAASTLVWMATNHGDTAGSSFGGICLALDSAVVGFTAALMTVTLANAAVAVGPAAILLGAFAAAGYAVAVATRPALRHDRRGSEAWFLGGVLVLCLNAAGEASRQLGMAAPAIFAAPGVALFGTLALAASAWQRNGRSATVEQEVSTESRLSLVPAVAAVAAIVVLSWLELDGRGTRAGFFGMITLFSLIVSRLLLTLVENRQLLRRVEQ